MFRNAFAIARQYTFPIVISQKTMAGDCTSTIGAFVVINDKGWILTAGHILQDLGVLTLAEQKAREIRGRRADIESDPSLSSVEKDERLSQIESLPDDHVDRASAWWGFDGAKILDGQVIGSVDIGVGRLDPFDPAWVSTYPTFKDPSKDFEPGASLCRLGYPFHAVQAVWNEENSTFGLSAGSMPPPIFPIDGIFTRTATINPPGSPAPGFPLMWLETSSPGLKGQSGGPIIDTQGSIWAIQSHTAHYPLGFNPPIPGSASDEREHQFLNVGRGVHAETIFGLLQELGVEFQVSSY